MYYAWPKDFMEAGKERLTRDTIHDVTQAERQDIKRENAHLKHLVADLSVQVHVQKQNGHAGSGTKGS
jgi:transposase